MEKKNEILIIGTLNTKYNHGSLIIDTNGICMALTAAMGMGGGHTPLIIEYEYGEKDRVENSEQC